jgi:DNA replication initiation complex subunit (GINS family)
MASNIFSTDVLTGETQGPGTQGPASTRPDTRPIDVNFGAPTPRQGAPSKKRKNSGPQRTEPQVFMAGEDTEKLFLREQFSKQAAQIAQQTKIIENLTNEVAALREQIARMEKAQNKGISKVAEVQKATKTFAQVVNEGKPSQPKTTPTAKKAAPQSAQADKKEKEGKSSPAPSKRMRRVVVEVDGAFSANTLNVRNTINAGLKASKAPKEVLVLAVAFNNKGNVILTLAEGCTAWQLLKFRQVVADTLASLKIKVSNLQADQQWFKFKVHGISTDEFGGEKGMDRLKEEIESFNPRITLTQVPRWLTSEASRKEKKFSSVVLAVQNKEEAKAVKKGVWISNKLCRSQEFVASRPTDQCGQCLKMGHHWKQCTTKPRCKICAGGHLSKDHYCKECKKKGVSCGHSNIKCANCSKGHMAKFPRCEYIVASRGARKQATTQEKEPEPHYDEEMADSSADTATNPW